MWPRPVRADPSGRLRPVQASRCALGGCRDGAGTWWVVRNAEHHAGGRMAFCSVRADDPAVLRSGLPLRAAIRWRWGRHPSILTMEIVATRSCWPARSRVCGLADCVLGSLRSRGGGLVLTGRHRPDRPGKGSRVHAHHHYRLITISGDSGWGCAVGTARSLDQRSTARHTLAVRLLRLGLVHLWPVIRRSSQPVDDLEVASTPSTENDLDELCPSVATPIGVGWIDLPMRRRPIPHAAGPGRPSRVRRPTDSGLPAFVVMASSSRCVYD